MSNYDWTFLLSLVALWLIVVLSFYRSTVDSYRRWRRNSWIYRGRCGSCGYDLRASPTRCPECGSEPDPSQQAEAAVVGHHSLARYLFGPFGSVDGAPSFGRYTDRARKVVLLANMAAERSGDRLIRPHHILAGLVAEGSGVGAAMIRALGADPAQIVAALAPGLPPANTPQLKRPLAPDSHRLIATAINESTRLRDNYVGTEHLLLALWANPAPPLDKVFADAGLTHAAALAKLPEVRVPVA